ncbi:MAG: nucleotide sugar dehydrogenase [Candidatus Bathyarchaeia archaeon]
MHYLRGEKARMQSPALDIKKEEVDASEKRGKYTVSIIGCGQNGILHTCSFAEVGFKVICVDSDQTIVNDILRGKTSFLRREIELKLKNYVKNGILTATTDFKIAVSQSDFVVITVPVEVDEEKGVDYSRIRDYCKKVGLSLRRGSVVIVASVMGFGSTEILIKDVLENASGFKVGVDFGLAYSPLQIFNGQKQEILANQKRIVAASDKRSLNAASVIIKTIAGNVVEKLGSIKVAEAAVLFEAVQGDVAVAVASEFAFFCEKAGIDYFEVYELAKACGSGTLALPMFADGKEQVEPYLFLENIENLELKLRMPATAREVNEEINRHVVNLVKDALKSCGKTLRRARISLLGVSQTPNMKSPPNETVKELVKTLEARGAKINIYDPYLSGELAEMQRYFKKNLTETLEGADCILLITGHEQFKRLDLKKVKIIMKMPAAIVDLKGIVEPFKVEREGFIYRGLGRGVWTK